MRSGTALVAVCVLAGSSAWAIPAELIFTVEGFEHICALEPVNGGVLITVSAGGMTEQLWFSNGYAGGTEFVKDIPPRDHMVNQSYKGTYSLGHTVYYALAPGDLWKSDGTTDGTIPLVSDIYFDGFTNSLPGVVFFYAYRVGDAPNTLWRSDGTVAGTYKLIDPPVPLNRDPSVVVDGFVYFACPDELNLRELYRSDGTIPGTSKVKDLVDHCCRASAQRLTEMGGAIYFFVVGDEEPMQLYRSDGTSDGTEMIYQFDDPEFHPPPCWTQLGNSILFFIDDGTHGCEPWITDGTHDGTRFVKDIFPGTESSHATQPLVLGDAAYFMADDGVHGRQLWKSDGTETGTELVFVLPPEAPLDESYRKTYGTAGGYVYFGWYDWFWAEYHLYRTTGTEAGTELFGVENPEGCAEGPYEPVYDFKFLQYGGQYYFGGVCEFYRINETGFERVTLESGAMADTAHCYPEPVLVQDRLVIAGDNALWAIDVATGFRFTRQPTPLWKEVGESFHLDVACVDATGDVAYQWIKDVEEVDGAIQPVYYVDYAMEEDEGWYICRATDASKSILETIPVFVQIFEAGSLPAAGILAMVALTTACAIGAARTIMRRKP